MSILRPRIAALGLLLVGCSDQGFNIFNRDECRRDPAACLPDEEPVLCDGEQAIAQDIEELACEPPDTDFGAVKFWDVRVDDVSSTPGGPRQLFTASLDGGPQESLLSIARFLDLGEGRSAWRFLRGRDGGELFAYTGEWSGPLGLLVFDHDLKPWARGSINGDRILMGPQGDIRRLEASPTTSTHFDGALTFGDFTGDGMVEAFGGTSVYDLHGNELVRTLDEHDRRRQRPFTPAVDVDGDGRRELLTYRGIVNQSGHYRCQVDDKWAMFLILDIEGDGHPEILVSHYPDENGDERISIRDENCAVIDEINFHDAVPDGQEVLRQMVTVRPVEMVAPLLERNRPAIVASFTRRIGDTGEILRNRSALFDHELNFVHELNGFASLSQAIAADLNGDGIYEIINTHWRDDEGIDMVGPMVIDAKSGEVTVLDDVAEVGMYLVYADIDGDGRGEIVASVRDHDGQWYIRAYKGAGPGFAAAPPFHYFPYAPYLHNPDGTPSQEPVRYDRLGMFNAMPSGGWWAGVNSDLRVRFTDVCDEDCPANSLTYTAQVGNHGYGDVGNDVLVSVYGERGSERTLLSEQRYRDVNAGEWNAAEPVTVRFQGEPFERLRAVVSGDGYDVQECDTENNEVVWNLDCR